MFSWKSLMKNKIFIIGLFLLVSSAVPLAAMDESTYPTPFTLLYPFFTLVMGIAFTLIALLYELFIKGR